MKSTQRLIDNIVNDDFRKCRIDLEHAVGTVMKKRVEKKKEDFIEKLNNDQKTSKK
jgi:hypothetical protein